MENKVLPTQHLATAWLRPCFGHTCMMRKQEESLEKEIIRRNMLGGRAKGRPKLRWIMDGQHQNLDRTGCEDRNGGMLCRARPTLGSRKHKNRKEQNHRMPSLLP